MIENLERDEHKADTNASTSGVGDRWGQGGKVANSCVWDAQCIAHTDKQIP